jgi:hypothetical protein
MVRSGRVLRLVAGLTFSCQILTVCPGFAQGPSAGAGGPALQDSVRALAEEVKALNTTIQDLRGEVRQSREETRELRGEVERLSLTTPKIGPVGENASVAGQSPAAVSAPPSPPSVGTESSAQDRLNRLEEDQQLLQAKVDDQRQSKVESASKYRVKLSGIVLVNLFGNSGTVDNQDVPNLALPPGATSTSGSVGATVRQSEIGLEAYGPTLAGARISGNVNFDFLGGFTNTSNGVTDDLVRLRIATVRFDWAQTTIVAGQDAPFFSPLSPASFASLGYPAFADAGNLWTWTPQLRVEHRFTLSEANRLLIQGGLLDPLSGEPPYSPYYRTPTAGEQSRAPAVASRVAWTHGASDNPLTLGAGEYFSPQNYGAGRTVDAWAATGDWTVPFGKHVSFSGELYRGRALGGLGAAEGRSVLFNGSASSPTAGLIGLNTAGGWTQLKFKATQTLEFNAAYGQDNPFTRDLRFFYEPTSYAYTSVGKNQNALVNAIYRPRSDVLFALEYRYLDTQRASATTNTAGVLNLSLGLLF